MRGVILAGGAGMRLHPLTATVSKHLLPVARKFMIEYPIAVMRAAKIKEVLIVVNPAQAGDYVRLLGGGKRFSVDMTYRVQTHGALLAAFALAESFVRGDQFLVCLGDQVFGDPQVAAALATNGLGRPGLPSEVRLVGKQVADVSAYGRIMITPPDRVARVWEKPPEGGPGLAATGLYAFHGSVDVFWMAHRLLTASANLGMTDLLNVIIDEGMHVACGELAADEFWTDAGTFEGIRLAEEFFAGRPPR